MSSCSPLTDMTSCPACSRISTRLCWRASSVLAQSTRATATLPAGNEWMSSTALYATSGHSLFDKISDQSTVGARFKVQEVLGYVRAESSAGCSLYSPLRDG